VSDFPDPQPALEQMLVFFPGEVVDEGDVIALEIEALVVQLKKGKNELWLLSVDADVPEGALDVHDHIGDQFVGESREVEQEGVRSGCDALLVQLQQLACYFAFHLWPVGGRYGLIMAGRRSGMDWDQNIRVYAWK
jgi:hypothetical protein